MAQDKKKSQVRESKPLAATPVSGLSGMHQKTRASLYDRIAKNSQRAMVLQMEFNQTEKLDNQKERKTTKGAQVALI